MIIEATEKPKKVKLTDRQKEYLELVVQGLENKEIAQSMGTRITTANNQIAIIRGKVGAANKTELALWAIRTGLAKVK